MVQDLEPQPLYRRLGRTSPDCFAEVYRADCETIFDSDLNRSGPGYPVRCALHTVEAEDRQIKLGLRSPNELAIARSVRHQQ
ncbi:hypothetical protein MPLB_1510032 [Mesorhizobium sp. ORS 3324]|nr:hypothetical protein MPLB_1510032 [Mesorhizobium sp. ORS 3324]